ncbi:phage portal protein [Mycobacterium sp. CVI_P3]|uniref:Phage portal protein n=1 Tax=Mycobacterium pinniadriaticum TaxID=2994102 RepID=A0ABT3SE91_9MYCO|nr:phage portal protein [Mycobacterium pinniadriaticum]MCX2931397.1 phage portal protein [Mycobacterium pinniadriaticum]MCX2937821.1 phage portal protein [Mycobacterium pinniadriaticum]
MALTPSEWFDKLNERFTKSIKPKWQDGKIRPNEYVQRNQALDTLWSYYIGDPPLPQVADEYEPVFREVMRKARCNYAPMCVAAMIDRMELQGLSTGRDSDTNGDDLAANIMDESGFAAQFKDLLGYLFAMGEAFGMVVPGANGEKPKIHAIDPRRCIGIPDRNNPVRLRAALIKEYDDIEDRQLGHLFLPGEKWTLEFDGSQWKRISDAPEEVKGLDDLGGIPIVRFENLHQLGEYEAHIDLLDRINDITLDTMVLSKFQAFKQRGVSGDEDDDTEYDDETTDETAEVDEIITTEDGKKQIKWSDVFQAGPGKVWKVPKDWKFWESGATDLTPMLNNKRDAVKEFAAVTFTPLYLITPDDANGSAEGAGLLRESLTSKVRDRRSRVTPSLKLLWRITFAMAGEADRGKTMKLLWGPIEFRSLAEKGSASAQAKGTLSRKRITREIWEMTPQEIDDNERELRAERLLDAALPGSVGGTSPNSVITSQQQTPTANPVRQVNQRDVAVPA